ncbi:MAG: pyridoxal phosphate-dependent aminotransferase [Planctomycetota bacterium]
MKSEGTRSGAVRVAAELADRARAEACLSRVARELIGSEILAIAAQIRARIAAGESVLNLTVGDYLPSEFPIPAALLSGIKEALDQGQTNYPPADGMQELRKAVVRHYQRELSLDYPVESCVIASGARPAIYAAYRSLVDPGDRVIYPVPSWNNNHYCHLAGAVGVPVVARADDHFMPSAALIAPHFKDARLLCLNSPLNPSGTMFTRAQLLEIVAAVADENHRRKRSGARPLVILYDQVYCGLTLGGHSHHTPVELLPEAAGWTIFVDGISKSFAATGLRVGWAIGPPAIVARMADLIGHMGAWAPRPEQLATARMLEDAAARAEFELTMRAALEARLERLHQGLERLCASGLPVRSLAPEGGIYLSAQVALRGLRHGNQTFTTNDAIRRYLLESAGIALVPFQAFGYPGEDGWFRLSVGAVTRSQIDEVLVRLQTALQRLGAA